MELNDQFHSLATLMFRERVQSTYWVEGWVGFTVGVDTTKESHPSCNLVTIL
jgi:hypothetical protein